LKLSFPVTTNFFNVHLLWLELNPAIFSSDYIASSMIDVISDSETIDNIFNAIQAAFLLGLIGKNHQISLDQKSLCLLKKNKWTITGDSLGLATYLLYFWQKYPVLRDIDSITATGALRYSDEGFLYIDIVSNIRKKVSSTIAIARNLNNHAIIIPIQQKNEILGLCFSENIKLFGINHDLQLLPIHCE